MIASPIFIPFKNCHIRGNISTDNPGKFQASSLSPITRNHTNPKNLARTLYRAHRKGRVSYDPKRNHVGAFGYEPSKPYKLQRNTLDAGGMSFARWSWFDVGDL